MSAFVRIFTSACTLATLAMPLSAAPLTFSAAAGNGAGIQSVVDDFRSALGALNANVVGSQGSGR